MKLLDNISQVTWWLLYALVACSLVGGVYYLRLSEDRAANRIPEALRTIQGACLGGKASIVFSDPIKVYCEPKIEIVVPEEVKP